VIGELEVRTGVRCELIDITQLIEEVVRESGISEGLCLVILPHTTAGITLNENWDPAVRDDALRALDRLVPQTGPYRHAEGNSPAHIKAMMLGFSVTIPVHANHLVLGPWQGVLLGEFDGPRRRRVIVSLLSGRPESGSGL